MSCWSNIEGTWSYKDMIGSKFKLKSISLSYGGVLNKCNPFRYSEMELTLKDIYFRVSTDGKIIPLFRMEEVCGKLFLGKDLELVEISKASVDPKICGLFVAGPKNYICGCNSEEVEEVTTTTTTQSPKEEITTSTTTTTPIPPEDDEERDPFEQNIDSWDIIEL